MSLSDQRPDPARPAGRDPRTRHQGSPGRRSPCTHRVLRDAQFLRWFPIPAAASGYGPAEARGVCHLTPLAGNRQHRGGHSANSSNISKRPAATAETFNDRRRTQRQQHPRRSQTPKAFGVAATPASAWTLRAASTLNRSATGANTRGQRLADSRLGSEPMSMYVSSWRVSTGLTGQPRAPSAMPWLPMHGSRLSVENLDSCLAQSKADWTAALTGNLADYSS